MPTVPCGTCKKTLNVPDQLAGKAIKCPACGGRVKVPGAADEDAAVEAAVLSSLEAVEKRDPETETVKGPALPAKPAKKTRAGARARRDAATTKREQRRPLPMVAGRPKRPKRRSMDRVRQLTGPTHLQYAGFWRRFAAWVVDIIIVDLVAIGIFYALMSNLQLAGSLQLLFGFSYFTIMEASSLQGTLGKLAIGIKVTDIEGRRIGYLQAFLRTLSKTLSSILCIGFIMAGFTEKKQALHDIIMACLVVCRKPKQSKRRRTRPQPDEDDE